MSESTRVWPTRKQEDGGPLAFTDLKRMRGQECDRPKCLAVELSKIGAIVVTDSDYNVMYVWNLGATPREVAAWHADNNDGDTLLFHIDQTIVRARMPE